MTFLPTPPNDPHAWRAEAACRGAAPALFFADSTAPAKALCRTCPSLAPCLAFAMDTGQEGVWGGTDDRDRKRIRQRQQKARRRAELRAS